MHRLVWDCRHPGTLRGRNSLDCGRCGTFHLWSLCFVSVPAGTSTAGDLNRRPASRIRVTSHQRRRPILAGSLLAASSGGAALGCFFANISRSASALAFADSCVDPWTGLVTIGAILIVAQLGAFLTALHRYETGLQAVPGTPIQWSPPGGTGLVVSAFLLGQVLVLGFVIWRFVATRLCSSESDSSTLAHLGVADQIEHRGVPVVP